MDDIAETREERLTQHARAVFPATFTVSGSEWSRSVSCSNGITMASDQQVAILWREVFDQSAFGKWFICAGAPGERMTVVPAGVLPTAATEEQYDPHFVTHVLHVAARQPEAKFNNVVDMLEWLNRD